MQFNEEMDTFTDKAGYKIEVIIVSFIFILSVLIDLIYGNVIFDYSVDIIIYLQSFNFTSFAIIFSNVLYYLLFLYPIFCFLMRNHLEVSLIFLLQTFALIYFEGFLKIIYSDTRPVFTNEEIKDYLCSCNYGKPSGHAMIAVSLPLLIYSDLNMRFYITKLFKISYIILNILLVLLISFSRLYLGEHSINQIMLGWVYGLTIFVGLKYTEQNILKYIIWPLIYKERFREKKTIFYVLFMMLLTNYFLIFSWVLIFNNFENLDQKFFNFKRCQICIKKLTSEFSTWLMLRSLPFNMFFGMIIGIYLSNRPFSKIRTQWDSLPFRKKILKIFSFLTILSLELFAFYPTPEINHYTTLIIQRFLVSFIVGYLFTTAYFDLHDFFLIPYLKAPNKKKQIIFEMIEKQNKENAKLSKEPNKSKFY